jgi:hypothetical protein
MSENNLEGCLYHLQALQKSSRGVTLTEDNMKCLRCLGYKNCPNYIELTHIPEFHRRYDIK